MTYSTRVKRLCDDWQNYSIVRYSPQIKFDNLMEFTLEKIWLDRVIHYLSRKEPRGRKKVEDMALLTQAESRFDMFKAKVVLEIIEHGGP